MANFQDLFEYNTWANERLLAVTDGFSDNALNAPMVELGGSVLYLLDHLASVEAAFLGLMTASGSRPSGDPRPYAEIRALFAANSAGYQAALRHLLPRIEERFEVPWFGRSFTIEQGLLHVATHSVQHRAGVAAGIARAGAEAPGLDYIMWLSRHR